MVYFQPLSGPVAPHCKGQRDDANALAVIGLVAAFEQKDGIAVNRHRRNTPPADAPINATVLERASEKGNGRATRASATAPLLRKEGSFETPAAEGSVQRSIYDLDVCCDSYGREIFVKSRDRHTGKPAVWYQPYEKGTRRFQRGPFANRIDT